MSEKIRQIRQEHPEWSALSDSGIAEMTYRRHYSDLPKEQVFRALGVKLEAPKGAAPAERPLFSLSQGSALNDYVTEGVNAAAGGVSSAANFIVPGNRVSKAIDQFVEDSQANFTDVARQGKQQLASDLESADGFGEEAAAALKYVAQNPGLALSQAVGSFAGPGAAIKGARMTASGLGLTAKGVARAGLGAGAATGGAMAGGDAAGAAYDLVIKAGGTPEQAEAAAREASMLPAAIGAAGGLVGAERVFAGAKGFAGNAASRALKTGAVEGLQEGIEEGVTQYEGQRAAMPYDPSIDPMKGVGGAATLGAALGAATGAGVSALEGPPRLPNNGPLSRGANLALDRMDVEAAQAGQPAPGLTEGQYNQAMDGIMAQGDADMKALKQAGFMDKGPSAYANAAGAPAMGAPGVDPLAQSEQPFDALADRIMATRETLADEGNRQAIREKFGQSALDEVLYYLNQADKPGQIPDQTRDNMLAMAEEIVSRSRLTPMDQPGGLGAGAYSAPERLGADVGVPQIGLDTEQTSVFRADAAGNVAPETNADRINTKQATSAKKERTQGGPGMEAMTPRDTMRGAGPGVMVGDGVLTPAERPARQQPAAGPVPRLVYRPNGEPFRNQRAAVLEQRRVGGDVVPVEGGWAVQTQGEADDVRSGETVGSSERTGADGAPDAVRSLGSDGRSPADGGVAVDERGGTSAGRDGAGVGRAGAVPDGSADRGIGEALKGKTPAFLKTKTVPEMTDEELKEAQAFYGPKHKRAKTIEKEMGKRAPKVPADHVAKSGRQGYEEPVTLDASRLKTLLERDGEPLVTKPAKLQAWRDGTAAKAGNIELAYRDMDGALAVNDGRHRIAHAAEQGKSVTVYIGKADAKRLADDVESLNRAPKAPAVAEPKEAKALVAPDSFEHDGLKIRQSRVKVGDEVKDRWIVQSPENAEREARGERQIGGDRIVDTREQAIQTATQEVKRFNDERERNAELDREEKARKDSEEQRKASSRGKTITERRADAVLDKQTSFPASAGLGTSTKRQSIEMAVEQGRAIVAAQVPDTAAKKRDQATIEKVRRAGYMLGLSNENIPLVKDGLAARDRLKADDYKTTEYRVYSGSDRNGSFWEITKTEYDYAQSLTAKAVQAQQDAPQDQAGPGEPAAKSKADILPEGWIESTNGFTKRPVYRFAQDVGQPFAVVTQVEGMKYEVQIRHGDKQLAEFNRIAALMEVLPEAREKLRELTGQAIHQDPGQAPESATASVVGDSLKKAARNEESTPGEMRKWLLGEIDKALLQAADRADYDDVVKRMGEKDATSMFTGNGFLGKNAETGFVTFDVPGDGKFKVRNSMRGLLEFKKKVSASPGFKDSGQKTVQPPSGNSLFGGSKMDAVLNMIEEGDFEAARDYAESVGISLDDVKVPKGDQKPKWEQFRKTGALPPQAPRPSKEWQFYDFGGLPSVPDSQKRQAVLSRVVDGSEYVATVKGAIDNTGAKYEITKDGKPFSAMTTRLQFSEALALAERAIPAEGAVTKPAEAPKADALAVKEKMSPRQFDEWIRKQATIQTEQFKGDRNHGGGDEGVGYIHLSGGVESGGTNWAGTARGQRDNRDTRLIFRTDENKIVWYDDATQNTYEVAKDDPRLEIKRPEPEPKKSDDYEEATVEVDGAEYTVMFDAPLATISDQSFNDSLYTSGIPGNVKVEFRKLRAEAMGKTKTPEAQAEPEKTGVRRDPAKVSAFNPYLNGDVVEIGGKDWTVRQGMQGWYITSTGDEAGMHPTIRGVRAMNDLIAEVEKAADEQGQPKETPQVTEAEARKRLTWRDLGQSGGEKTWGLYYDDGDGRGMRYGTVSKFTGGRWGVEGHDGGKYEGLQPAKAKAEDLAVERLRRDGYVAQEQAQQAATGAIAGATAEGARSAPAVKQAKPSARIEDIGEKIGGASKDVWTSFKDDLNAVADGDIANQPLSKIWPAPDYQKLIDDGMDAGAVALVRSFRDEIPAKPRATWKVKRWAEQVKTLREFANDLLSGSSTADQFRQSARNLSAMSNGLLGRADLYLEVGHGKSLEGIRLVEHHYTLYRGRENVKLWAVERDAAATAFSNWPQEIATGDTKEQAIEAFKGKYATLDAEKQVKKASFDVISTQGKFYVAKKVGRNYAKLAGPFATVQEARDHRMNNLAELEKALESYKEIPKERRDVNEPRVGEDMRNGQDVTPDFFAKTFGFRGVEFGNWVEQSRRQKDLNDAFDALMDMAAVLGLPPKAISLNGELGLAFGARGGGGVGAAAAHYEHSKVVINLTKKEGAGSLGHEWWHAVDNYFSRMRKQPGEMMTTALDVSLASRGSNFVARDGVRREMVQAFGKVVSAIKQTAMKVRAARLDSKRSKEYWTTGEEMSARAFESYLIAKLQDQQASNDYLANVVDQRTWDAMASLGIENENSYPYPTADEIPAIRGGFDQFFQAVQTREDDAGNVAMFSRQDEGFRRQDAIAAIAHLDLVEDMAAQLMKGWNNAPNVEVLRSMEDAPDGAQRENQSQLAGGATGEPEAFFYKGKVYLMAGHMRTVADVRRAVFHEVLGHLGLRGLYGQELGSVLDRVAILQKQKMSAKAIAYGKAKMIDGKLQYGRMVDGVFRTAPEDVLAAKRITAEELLAEIAQTNPSMGFVRRAVAAIRSWLRRNVPALAKMRMTDDEIIRELIVPVQKFIKDGPPDGGLGLLPAFRRDRGFSRSEGQRVSVKRNESGERVYAAGGVMLDAPIESERFEVIPGPGQKILNYAIMPTDSFDVLGNMEVLVENGQPVSILDINVDGRNKGVGAKAVGMLLAAHPNTDMNVSNIVPSAQGFWEKMGIPTQNREEGAAYDGTINHATYLDAQAGRGAQGILAEDQGQNRQADTRAEGSNPQALGGSEVGFGRTQAAQQFTSKAREAVQDFFGSAGAQVDWLDRTFKTQYAKAQKFPAFRAVFNKLQDYIEGVSTLANEAADNAPSILPKLENWRDLAKTGLKEADAKAVAAPIFEGTLSWARVRGQLVPMDEAVSQGFDGEAGVVFTDKELRDQFKLTDEQIGYYREFRAAVDESLDQLVSTEVIRLLGDVPPAVKAMAMTREGRVGLRGAISAAFENQEDPLLKQINDKFDHIDRMKARGYAPLSRFGKFWVHVVDQDGQTQYFGMEEARSQANRLARTLREEFPGATVEQGVMSQEFHKLMSAVPVDAMELFASAIGADQSEVFQKYIQLAKNNRSTMKRLIKRKGTSGFSDDVPRVLASFVTSNARASSTALNIKDAKDLARDIRDGDIKDEAIKLIESVTEPEESGAAIRSVMFTNFIGGSIASAVVNITQPFMMTLPYLSQWGGALKAGGRLVDAARMIATGVDESSEIGLALKRAEIEGVVSPQEIHHLIDRAAGGIGSKNLYLKKLALLWSGPFSVAEQFNRRVSFLAAYQTAKAEGIANPFGFAEKAVIETQGLYNAGNKPNVARGAIGATAMTFKQYSIHYLEWLARMAKSGPDGKKAAALALVLLMMAAGTDGLPFMDDMDDVFDTVGQAMGYDTNTKRARREAVASVLGEELAEVATRGFSAAAGFPVDLSIRMGMGNLLPATDLLLKSNTDTARSLAEIAGPGGAMFTQYRDAARELLGGDLAGAIQKASPVALQNLMKAAKMAETGEYRDQRDRKVTDVDGLDVGMKALSFQPAQIARESTRMAEARQSESLAKTVENEITDKWARAIADGDREAEKEALKMRDDWNEKNPEQPIVVKRSQAVRKARNMKMERRDRFLKTVSPERRALVDKEIS